MKKTNHIFEETQRESIINRPHNLFGSVKPIPRERFCINEDKIEFRESSIVPALLKIFMEAVDNPVDVAIKNKLDIKIDIEVTSDTINIKDNGPGIPNTKCDIDEYLAYKAFCKYNTSSNYKEFKNQGQKGVNGLGIKGSNTLSTNFTVVNDDGNLKVTIESSENNLHHKIKESKSSGKTGVEVSFKPDFKIIHTNNSKIDDEHISRMREYVLMQSLTYPNITFTFNKKKLNYNSKKFVSLFDKTNILEETDDYFLAITSNEFDDFKQISYVNGLETSKGGTHIDYIINNIINPIREKLLKKYKTIKPADIKNKLQLILVAKNVKDIDWDGQTKESITTPNKYWIEYFKDLDFNKIANKILKTSEIIDPITEVYKIKEQLKKNLELKNADKAVNKKPKSEKFMPPIGKWTNIFLAEGDCLEENTEILMADGLTKKLKEVNADDLVISGDGSIQRVKCKVKSIRESFNIKTKYGNISCSGKHRFYVYDTEENNFIFIDAESLFKDINRYKMLRNRINETTQYIEIIQNDIVNNIMKYEDGEVYYTANDYFVVFRKNAYLRVFGEDILRGDLLTINS